MADKQINELPALSELTDDSLLPVYVPGSSSPAQNLTGAKFKKFARDSVSEYVESAITAANNALAAAEETQRIADSVQGVGAEAAAAEAANQAAQAAKAAAEAAQEAAEAAAQSAADDAVEDVASNMRVYVTAAQNAQKAAEEARDQAQAIAGGDFLPLAGGTLTGPLTLSGAPTADLHAATKKYVDDSVPTNAEKEKWDAKQDPITFAAGGNVQISQDGGTITISAKPLCRTVTLSSGAWTDNAQTVSVAGVLEDETKQRIMPIPSVSSQSAYIEAGILCTGQSADSLTFTATESAPTSDITVYVTIEDVIMG